MINELKSTAFGGFSKESVLQYLRQVAQEHDEEKEALKKQVEAVSQELLMLRSTMPATQSAQTQTQTVQEAGPELQPPPQSVEQESAGGRNLEQVNKIADALQEQAKTLELLLAENQRLQAEVDQYRSREQEMDIREAGLKQREAMAKTEAEALLNRAKEDAALVKFTANREVQELLQGFDGRLASMSALAQELSALCQKGEQLGRNRG